MDACYLFSDGFNGVFFYYLLNYKIMPKQEKYIMKTFNITAQIYEKTDKNKQTILMNEIIESSNSKSAEDFFKLSLIQRNDILVKILSIEQISQDAA